MVHQAEETAMDSKGNRNRASNKPGRVVNDKGAESSNGYGVLRSVLERANVLREIVERAFDPYFDRGLAKRVTLESIEWKRQTEKALREQIDPQHLEALRIEAAGRLAELKDAIADINDRLRLAAADHFTLPVIKVLQPEIDEGAARRALVSFDQDWVEATRALIQRKAYGGPA
jgi:hypothetical protein